MKRLEEKIVVALDCELAEPKDIISTLDSLVGSVDNGERLSVVLLGVESIDNIDVDRYSFSIANKSDTLSLAVLKNIAKADFIAALRAGSTVSKGIFNPILIDNKRGTNKDIYVALEGSYDYILNKNIEKKYDVLVGRDPESIWVGSNGFVIAQGLLVDCVIDSNRYFNMDTLQNIFIEGVARTGAFRVLKSHYIHSLHCHEDRLMNESYLYDQDWYKGLNAFWEEIAQTCNKLYEGIPHYLQYSYLYSLQWRFVYNYNNLNKCTLWQNEVGGFMDNVGVLLSYLDVYIIVSKPSNDFYRVVSNNLKIYLLKLRNKGNKGIFHRYYKDDTSVVYDGVTLVSAASTKLDVDLMDISNGTLEISGSYSFPMFSNDFRLVAEYEGKEYQATHVGRYSWFDSMGTRIFDGYDYTFNIPLFDKVRSNIKVYLVSAKNRVQLNFNFRRPMAKLSTKDSYWNYKNKIIYYRSHRIVIDRYRKKRHLSREYTYLISLLKDDFKWRDVALRITYYITRPYFKNRRVWIYQDKVYKGGDNGEYAFKYAYDKKDGVKKYYLLNKDSPDRKRLKKYKPALLKTGSIKNKLLFLNAERIFATHTSIPFWHGFDESRNKQFRGLFNYDVMFIQHGLSVQRMSKFLNRIYDNTKLYFIASKVEEDNLLRPEYGYNNNQLVRTGVARYDGLVNSDRKQILITPTWRTYLAVLENHGSKRGYSESFKNSRYRKLYESLINNKKLLDKADRLGYKIVYLLHPNVSSQIDDYEVDPNVEIVPASGDLNYEKILTESSLMVTDYSGVQFDFAYMYKPVLYFHPPELPPSYEEGAYKYDSMALGDIYKSVDSLVGSLCEYMENDCKIKSKYKKRIDSFFYNHDRDNSKRIYNESIKYSDDM